MRPLRLTMTAFGSYRDTTVIDFERIGNELYLITGNTGAGKTTIFDAIVFALYGGTSGESRNIRDMHSDFAQKNDDTSVELEFEHNGSRYLVSRGIHLKHVRGTDTYKAEVSKCSFSEIGKGDTVVKAEEITERVEELLGMDRGQFCQIEMLAQGEFRKFLEAKSREKKEILGKIFGTMPQKYCMNLLKKADDMLSESRTRCENDIRHDMTGTFVMPERLDEAEKSALTLPEKGSLSAETLDSLIGALERCGERDKAEIEAESERRGKLAQRRDELSRGLDKAKNDNEALDRLEEAEKNLAEKKNAQDYFAQRGKEADAAEKALRIVDPAKKELDGSRAKLSNDTENKSALENKLTDTKIRLEIAVNKCDGNEEKKKEAERLGAEAALLKDSISDYDEAERLAAEKKKAENELSSAKAMLDNANAQSANNEKELFSLKSRRDELEGADSTAVGAKADYDSALRLKKDIESGLCVLISDWRRKSSELGQAGRLLSAAIDRARAEKSVYDEAYSRFMNGQKAKLSAELRDEVEKNGSAKCPVCGSEICRGHEGYAKSDGREIPSQNYVEAKRAAAEKADKSYREADKYYESLSSAVSALHDEAIKAAERNGIDRDVIFVDGEVDRILEEYGAEVKKCAAAYTDASLKAKEYAIVKEKIRVVEEECIRLRAECLKETNNVYSSQSSLISRTTEYNEKKKKLKYSSRAAALEELDGLVGERRKLLAEIAASEKEVSDLRDEINGDEGRLEQITKSTEDDSEKLRLAERAYSESISAAGFADEAEYLSAIKVCEGMSPEKWIKKIRNLISAYERELTAAETTYLNCRKAVEGLVRRDITAVSDELEKAEEEYKRSDYILGRLTSVRDNHLMVCADVREKRASLAKLSQVAAGIEALDNLARGSGENKVTFDTYALQAVFAEILDTANERINIASSGRYSLLMSESTEGQGMKGLDIDVKDMMTGTVRKSNSLSGGEGFLVSLSLALGLSDVVRNHAGATRIDSMFIDEGFGSLDGDSADKAIEVLNMLSDGGAQVGIISHVEKLGACIPSKIIVTGGAEGSSAKVVIG